MSRLRWPAVVCLLSALLPLAAQEPKTPSLIKKTDKEETNPYAGFEPLFRGKSRDPVEFRMPRVARLNPWRVYYGEGGLIDCSGLSDPGTADKHLWTERSFRDFVLLVDWRVKLEPGFRHRVPLLGPDGLPLKDERGKDRLVEIDDINSGILLRGREDVRVNICKWPSGSGEILPFRTDPQIPAEQRASYMPKEKADSPPGEWNTFEITLKRDRIWVKLNDKEIITNALLPDVPKAGPIGLEHKGKLDPRRSIVPGRIPWREPPSLVQFRNIYIKELK